MNGLKTSPDSCERFEALCTLGAEALSAEENIFLRDHADRCEACALEAKLMGLLSSGPSLLEPLDDISRRTAIHRALDALDAERAATTRLAPSVSPVEVKRSRHRRRVLLVASLALAMTAGLLLVRQVGTGRRGAASAPAAGASAQVLMCSGGARGELARGVGARLRPGARLISGGGPSVLFMPAHTLVLLDRDSTGALARNDESRMEFRLEQGRLLASVLRKPKDPVFAVGTPAGRVVVTGTLFAVEVRGGKTVVSVLHGRVRVEQSGRRPVYVSTREQFIFGGTSPEAMTEPQRRWAEEGMGVIQMIGVGDHSQLVAHSTPTGALVRVDGRAFGTTPLTTNLLPGYRNVSFELSGYIVSRQFVQLPSGGHQQLMVQLAPQLAAAVRQDPPRPVVNVPALNIVPHAPPVHVRRSHMVKGKTPATLPVAAPAVMTSPVLPAVTPAQLLKRARELRAARRWREAAAAYQLLISTFSASAQAHISRVSLGMIQLDHLRDAAAALRSFSAYLKGGGKGILAQEAAWGKIRALRALGHLSVERQAIVTFLKRWPGAIQAGEAKHRLKILSNARVEYQ